MAASWRRHPGLGRYPALVVGDHERWTSLHVITFYNTAILAPVLNLVLTGR